MFEVTVKKSFIKNMNKPSINENTWLEIVSQTEKAYQYTHDGKFGWIPKSVVAGCRGAVDSVATKKSEAKYFINERMLFGLESMRDKCTYLIECESDSHTLEDIENLYALHDECEELICKAQRKVDGKTYGRILQITQQREYMRYVTCLESGMSERDAAKALEG